VDELMQTSTAMGRPDLWGAGLKTVAMLSIVVAVMIVVLFLIRRFVYARDGLGHGGLIRVLCIHHLSPKERIGLVDVAGEKLVIGITPENITCLTTISDSEIEGRIGQAGEDNAGKGLFRGILSASMKGRGRSNGK
jgi:flagellar biosynthetic protein FliO